MTGSVKDYYEHFGWEKDKSDAYQDTAKNVDLRPVMMRYYESQHRREKRKLGNGGRYFLDIGCGANPAVDYSTKFAKHICVDFSLKALEEAGKKLGEKKVLVCANVLALPFKNEVIDGVLCAHVIYHVPAAEQPEALKEVGRVLSRDGTATIFYSNGDHAYIQKIYNLLLWFYRTGRKVFLRKGVNQRSYPAVKKLLYFYAHDIGTIKKMLKDSKVHLEITCHRILAKHHSTVFVREGWSGRLVIGLCIFLEGWFPHLMAWFGQYTTIVMRKNYG